MSITMSQLDSFIETAINRLSSESAPTRSAFYIDLRAYQQRITQRLVDDAIAICASRGLNAVRNGDGLTVHVDLDTCLFNSQQTQAYNTALSYARNTHGNHL